MILKRGRANHLWHGHPWVYSGAVAREEGSYEPGDVVAVTAPSGVVQYRVEETGRS